ncbi:MAG: hypothetical protein LBC79_04210, partial [Deltaproteobacteria bacterium]|nr:hypothetical protein [Deltaproteobacteria bacterium]
MKWFNNLKLQSKLLLTFAFFVSLMVLSNIFAVSQLVSMDMEYRMLINTSIQRQVHLIDAIGDLTKVRFHNLARMYEMAKGVHADVIAEQYDGPEQRIAAFVRHMQEYRGSTEIEASLTEEERQLRLKLLREIDEQFIKGYVRYTSDLDAAVEANDAQRVGRLILHGVPMGNEITVKLEKLRDAVFATVTSKTQAVSEYAVEATNLVAAIAACLVAISSVAAVLIAYTIKAPIESMQHAMVE